MHLPSLQSHEGTELEKNNKFTEQALNFDPILSKERKHCSVSLTLTDEICQGSFLDSL